MSNKPVLNLQTKTLHRINAVLRAVVFMLLALFANALQAAITWDSTPTSGDGGTNLEIIQDNAAGAPTGQYIGINAVGVESNLYLEATVGGVGYSLDLTEDAVHFVGSINGTFTGYWYLNIPNSGNGSFQVRAYDGDPLAGATLISTSPNYTITSADGDQAAAANKLDRVVVNGTEVYPAPGSATIQIGQEFDVVVDYLVNSGNQAANLRVDVAASDIFDPTNTRLLGVQVTTYDDTAYTIVNESLSEQLYFKPAAGGINAARATYRFITIGTAAVNLSPVVSARSGQYKYNSDYGSYSITIAAPTNTVTLSKSASPNTLPSAGGTTTYSVVVDNPSGTAVNLDDFVDVLPVGTSYVASSGSFNGTPVEPVISGQTLTFPGVFNVPTTGGTLIYDVLIPGVDGSYVNSAVANINGNQIDTTATLGDNAPATATVYVGPPPSADLSLTKTLTSGNTTPAVGDTVTYDVVVSNDATSTDTATAVQIEDVLDTGLNFTSAVLTGGVGTECTEVTGTITCVLGDIAVGASKTVVVTASIATGTAGGTVLTNTAEVSVSSVTDPDSTPGNHATLPAEDDSATVDVTVAIAPILNVSKTTSTAAVVNTASGAVADYKIVVSNDLAGAQALGVQITDVLPAGFTYASTTAITTPTSPSCLIPANRTAVLDPTAGDTSPIWGDWLMPLGCTIEIDFKANIASSVTDGTYNNSANVTTTVSLATINNYDGGLPANTSEDVTLSSAVLSLSKTTSTPTVNKGNDASYTITVSNSGTADATGVDVTDTLPAGFTYASTTAIGGTATRTVTTDPTLGAAVPTWGTWIIPANNGTVDGSLAIEFTATVDLATPDGSYDNSVSASSSDAKTITNYDGTLVANMADDVEVGTFIPANLSVTKTTSTRNIDNTSGTAQAIYTISISNVAGAETAIGVNISDTPESTGFTYASSSISLSGGATRSTTTDPTLGDSPMSWSDFVIPASGQVDITVTMDIANTVLPNIYDNSATVTTLTAGATANNYVGTDVLNVTEDVVVHKISSLAGSLIINEVLYQGTQTTTADNDEFIELYNAGASSIDLTTVKLIDGNLVTGDTDTASGNLTGTVNAFDFVCSGIQVCSGTSTLAPGEYAVVWVGPEDTLNVPSTRSASGAVFQAWMGKSARLGNTADDVWLFDTNNELIDYVAWGSSSSASLDTDYPAGFWNDSVQTLLDGVPSGTSISLTPNGVDTNESDCWEATASADASLRCAAYIATVDSDPLVIIAKERITSVAANNNTVIPTGVTISGDVFEDNNTNSIKDSSEDWTSGTTVFVNLVRAGVVVQSVQVDPGTGSYSLTNVADDNYSIVVTDSAINTVATVPTGWLFINPDLGSIDVTIAGVGFEFENFGLFHGSVLSGTVFQDDGAGTILLPSTANDGIQNGEEVALDGVSVRAADDLVGTTVYDTAITDANGNYSLYIPNSLASSTLYITEANLTPYVSTAGAVGNTAGTYSLATDTVTFNYVAGNSYTGVNFADVLNNTFTNDSSQTTFSGTYVSYSHVFAAGSEGAVTFSTSDVSTPTNTDWIETLYQDADCDGVVDSGENEITASIALNTNENVCIIHSQLAPVGASYNDQNEVTITASFAYANSSLVRVYTRTDVTIIGDAVTDDLNLVKGVDKSVVLPGETLTYTITYSNTKTDPLDNIVITDTTPAFTTFVSATCITPLANNITGCVVSINPSVGGTGDIEWTLSGSLLSTASGSVEFQVIVDP